MSITVTVEELRAYESAMDKWCLMRLRTGELVSRNDGGIEIKYLNFRTPLDEWAKQNPPPKLIPSV